MQLYVVLTILVMTLSTASGLRCFTCVTTDPESCTLISTCPAFFNRCFSLEVNGLVTKGCLHSALCVNPMDCCEGDLCNSAIPDSILYFCTASGLRCFTCVTTNPESCTQISTCSAFSNRCYSKEVNGLITKGCKNSVLCVNSMNCCEGDLCNSAIPTRTPTLIPTTTTTTTTTPAASGLRCFTCATIISEFCTRISTCPAIADSCFSLEVRSLFSRKIVKGCQVKELCVKSMDCCEGDLCNSAIPTVPSVILPLVFSAIVTLFL
ncbi:ly6/PLAUR domain-containing protein 3-like [Seriola aureovittata]|uniref:ly6/PLAUR domain-containing protein 3-like n=1 Tax=Seriola aureovittata TaxID=2871759 RepID=UPI0024BDD703|nr:ly6/PLAUR domain-containing protein 3-like [Seriola aureovittata]